MDQVQKTIATNTLRVGIHKVVFTKSDGTKRVLFGTLDEHLIDTSTFSGNPKHDPSEVRTIFDMEKDEWRSFRWDSLVSIDNKPVINIK